MIILLLLQGQPHPDSGLTSFQKSYRFDQCRYSTPWRKRTRILLDGDLAGERHLCTGGHSHLQLRGRSTLESIPSSFALLSRNRLGRRCYPLREAVLASCSCIGEASNPGPAKRQQDARDPQSCIIAFWPNLVRQSCKNESGKGFRPGLVCD